MLTTLWSFIENHPIMVITLGAIGGIIHAIVSKEDDTDAPNTEK
jgi:hypothetical protein